MTRRRLINGGSTGGGGSNPAPPVPTDVVWDNPKFTKYVSGPNGGNTGALDTTNALFYVVGQMWFGAGGINAPNPPTDSVGGGINTYTEIVPPGASTGIITEGSSNWRFWQCKPTQNSATMTWTISGTGNVPSCYVYVLGNDYNGPVVLSQISVSKYNSNAKSNISWALANSHKNNFGLAFYANGVATGTFTEISSFTKDQSTAFSAGVALSGATSSFKYSVVGQAKTPEMDWSGTAGTDKISVFMLFQAGITNPILANDYEDHAVIPIDNSDTVARPLITGVYNLSLTTPASIEYEIIRKLDSTILQGYAAGTAFTKDTVAGSYSFKLSSVPQGSDYVIRVRTKDGGGSVIETSSTTARNWGVSPNVLAETGQSDVVRMNTTIASPGTPNEWARFFTGSRFELVAGNGYVAMHNALIAGFGPGLGGTIIPSCSVQGAYDSVGYTVSTNGATPKVEAWNNGTANGALQLLKGVLSFLRGKPTGVFDIGGSTDAVSGVAEATFYAARRALRTAINTYLGLTDATLPWFVSVNSTDDTVTPDTDAQWQACKDCDLGFAANEANAHLVSSLSDLPKADAYHLTGPGYGIAGLRCAQSILHYLIPLSFANDGVSMKVLSATRSGAVITVTIDLNGGTVLNFADTTTVGTGQVGWLPYTSSPASPLSIASTAFTANKPEITLSADPGGPVNLLYFYGKNLGINLTKVDYNNVFPQGSPLQVPILPISSLVPIVAA